MKKILMVESQEFFSDVKIGAHHYAENFSKNGYEVLWLSPAFTPIHKYNKAINIKERERLNVPKRNKLQTNIYGYSPKVLVPFIGVRGLDTNFIGKHYLDTGIPSVKKVLNKIEFDEVDILWISNIKMYYLKDMVKYKKLVYRVADEKKGFKNFFPTLEKLETELIRKADLLYGTSHRIIDKCKRYREDVKYLPNGVNVDDFIIDNSDCPKDILDIKNEKICIYIGAIAEWLDIDKIVYCVRNMPDMKFIFIGPKHINFEKVESYSNVRYLGKKKYEDLKKYLKFSDVAWIPFKINELTDAINPVKLYEYLAAGVPTVTTNFKEMQYIEGPFEICYDSLSMYKSLQKCLDGIYIKSQLVDYAKNNTWEKRFIKIIKDVE